MWQAVRSLARRWTGSRLRWLWGLVAALGLWGPANVSLAASPPIIHGSSAAVLDASNGKILWQYNGALHVPMASTTKMMTALVALALEHNHTGMEMVVPPEVSQAYGEMLGLRPGETYTFQELLEAMLLPSDNDAAIAVAVDTAGSLPRFVALMNEEAAQLGLADTHYTNPDGLDDPGQYSSAVDLARLGDVAMANPVIASTVDMRSAMVPSPRGSGTELIGSINTLLFTDPYVNGIKTGYTNEALNLAVESATKDGHSVIAVVTGEPKATTWSDVTAVLNYGFSLLSADPPAAAPAGSPPNASGASLAQPIAYANFAAEAATLKNITLPPGFVPSMPASSVVQGTLLPAYSPSSADATETVTRPKATVDPHTRPLTLAWVLVPVGLALWFGWAVRERRRRVHSWRAIPWRTLEGERRSIETE